MKKQKKILGAALSLVLVALCAVGGTLAWLTDKTDTVTNTFTVGNVSLTLKEHSLNDDGKTLSNTWLDEGKGNTYHLIPGTTYGKDPTVTIGETSEDCWVFLKVKASTTLSNYLTYTLDSAWQQYKDANGNPVDGVYYQAQPQTKNTVLNVLQNKTVTVSDALNTETVISDLTLAFTACAVQSANVTTVADAYAKTPAEFRQ